MLRPIILIAVCALAGCASKPVAVTTPPAAAAPAAEAPPPVSTYVEKATKVDRVIIGGQPLAIDLASLKSAGVTRVINLRTAEEMKTVGYDEPAALADAEFAYRHVPLGGPEFPYTPAVLDAFNAEMHAADGKVLLHCASGGRAGLVYAAWLVKYRGQTPDQAMRTLESLGGWPLPMEKLLGRPLTVQFATPDT